MNLSQTTQSQEKCVKLSASHPCIWMAISIITLLLWYLLPDQSLFDFTRLWKAAHLLRSGQNPYALPDSTAFVEHALPARGPSPNGPSLSLLWLPPMLTPFLIFSLFTLPTAKSIFLLTEFMGTITALWLTIRSRQQALGNVGSLFSAGWVAMLIVPFGTLIHGVNWGSPSWIMWIALAILIDHCGPTKGGVLPGVALFFLCLKPHVTAPLVAIVVMWSLHQRHWTLIATTFFVTLACGLLSLYLDPQIGAHFLADWKASGSMVITSASLPSLVHGLFPRHIPFYLLLAPQLLLCVVGACVGWRVRRIGTALALFSPWALAFAPNAWGHDFILLAPACAWLTSYAWMNKKTLTQYLPSLLILSLAQCYVLLLAVRFWVPGYSFALYPVLVGLALIKPLREIVSIDALQLIKRSESTTLE